MAARRRVRTGNGECITVSLKPASILSRTSAERDTARSDPTESDSVWLDETVSGPVTAEVGGCRAVRRVVMRVDGGAR